MRVELLYWDGDPNYMTARQRLVEVLTEDAFETPIQMIAINSAADAQMLEFPGSPTIRIDGTDIHSAGVGEVGLRVRLYPSDDAHDGTLSEAVPGKQLIRSARGAGSRVGPRAGIPGGAWSASPGGALDSGGPWLPTHDRQQEAQHIEPAAVHHLATVRRRCRAETTLRPRRA